MGIWQKLYHPVPAPPAFGAGKTLPEPSASFLKRLSLGWISPLLLVGFSRPLEANDLWELDDTLRVAELAERVSVAYAQRRPKGTVLETDPEAIQKAHDKANQRALVGALHSVLWTRFWGAGVLKLVADALTVTSPLVTSALLTFLSDAYGHKHAPELVAAPHAAKGFGLTVGLALMQLVAAICENHYQQRVMGTGMLVRSTLSAMVFRKSLRLSGKARIAHSKGHITTLISENAPQVEETVNSLHQLWVAPILIIVGIALLIQKLHVSALVGLGVIILYLPVMGVLIFVLVLAIKANVTIVDERVRIMQEVLGGVRAIKMYGWETYFQSVIGTLRDKELAKVRRWSFALSWMFAVTDLTPIIASTLSFITYALLGHKLQPAIVFSALQLFGIIREPLTSLPLTLGLSSEAVVAVQRISKFLAAEEALETTPPLLAAEARHDDNGDDISVRLDKAGFTWEANIEDIRERELREKRERELGKEKVEAEREEQEKERKRLAKQAKIEAKKRAKAGLPVYADDKNVDGAGEPLAMTEKQHEKEPFKLIDIDMRVPRGALVAIVGRVGSGKSSLLQALAGEMRKTVGDVAIGGALAYAPQSPWIVNATLRDNIIFGEPVDEARYRQVIKACALQPDLDVLQHGDQTEIGERGINLSGGQKARICLARAAYAHSEIVLLDDVLSAVDAHVGQALVSGCLLDPTGPMAGRTKLLATHALHVLPHADEIYVLEGGRLEERGTYTELIARGGPFARLIEEFGNKSHDGKKIKAADDEAIQTLAVAAKAEDKPAEGLMQDEDRVLGKVQFNTYKRYFQAAGGVSWMPWLIFCLTMGQGLSVASNLTLGWWTGQTIRGFGNTQYMTMYACLGAGQGLFSFVTSFSFCLAAIAASRVLFGAALERVLRSPVSFFDTTPMGRIVSRLTKDVNTLDQELSINFYFLFNGSFGVFGTVGLVFYNFPYLGIMFAPLGLLYTIFFLFYRRNSVEVKRLDSILRSSFYSSYIEALSGIATIHATKQEGRFIRRAEDAIDLHNRAAYVAISIARWLDLRLNVFSSTLILGIGLFAVGERNTVNPANVGVVLTYALNVLRMLAELVSQFATMEQNLNAVERLIAFSDLPQEGVGSRNQPPVRWPQQGAVSFRNVVLSYREGLPDVLRGVSFDISPGEKVGVVGRTGAGKTSLVQALLRMFEIKSGTIEVDGVDIRTLDLQSFRSRFGVVPQESVFLGTLRDSLDPLRLYTDAELLEVLQKAHLLPPAGVSNAAAEIKFTLDASMGNDGVSLSAGERQQLALCRVLVKSSKIVILDEATSSVDAETDAKLQETIRDELNASTVLCIAHRLNTIVSFDRVLVMDRGQVAEFDGPLVLFDRQDSIFRSLCDQASISREDIVRMRSEQRQQRVGGSSSSAFV